MSCGEKWGRKGVRVEVRDVGEASVGDGAGEWEVEGLAGRYKQRGKCGGRRGGVEKKGQKEGGEEMGTA